MVQTRGGTAEHILLTATELTQTRGFNGFSFADVADRLGMTKAALHYHFPSKATLGVAMVQRYGEQFDHVLQRIDTQRRSAVERLRSYVALYTGVLDMERMCLCGMLAAEQHTLPAQMQRAVLAFFDQQERWLTDVLTQGVADDELILTGSPQAEARLLLDGLEGAMPVAATRHDVRRFKRAAALLLAHLRSS